MLKVELQRFFLSEQTSKHPAWRLSLTLDGHEYYTRALVYGSNFVLIKVKVKGLFTK